MVFNSSRPRRGRRFAWLLALALPAWATGTVRADPTWYTAGTGGFNPNIADFYQHQNWVSGGPDTGWEGKGGWCYPVAYADVYYDWTKRGYTGLFANSSKIIDPAKWFNAAYKPSDPMTSDIAKVATAMLGKDPQVYLNNTGHNPAASLQPLLSNWFSVKGDGTASGTTMTAFQMIDEKVRAGDDFLITLKPGTTAPWWKTSFHWLAGAGVDVKNNTVFVADPDSNRGSAAANAAPNTWKASADLPGFPGPLASKNTDPIPIPAAPAIGNAATYNTYYAGLALDSSSQKITGDAADARYTGTNLINLGFISAPKSFLYDKADIPGKGWETSLALNSGTETVDKIFIAPTSSLASASDLFSFSLAGSTWSTSEKSQDPFANPLSYGGVEYDLTGGSPLTSGEQATAMLGTTSDFSASGYEVFLHFAGDASNLWDPEVYGPIPSGSDLTHLQSPTPEPSSIALAVFASAVLAGYGRHRRRTL
jgi:hypothetical protein